MRGAPSPTEQLVVSRVCAAFGFTSRTPSPEGDLAAARLLAERHRVLPAFDAGVVRENEGKVSTDVMANIQMQMELRKIIQTLDGSEIDVLLFKGLSLYRRCYGKVLRPCADIDILVHPWAYGQTVRLLAETGMVGSGGVLRSSTGLEVDIHTSAVETHIAPCPDVSEIFSRRRWEPALEAYTLNDADHLFVLLMHGFKHNWCKLVWILDVALMARVVDDADFQRLETMARRLKARKRVILGLALAHRYFPQPRTLNASVQADDEINRLIQRYEARLFQTIPNTLTARCAGAFNRRTAYDEFGQWLRYVRIRSVHAVRRREMKGKNFQAIF